MTHRFRKFISFFMPVLMLMTMMAGTAQAALLDFGPIVPEVVGSTPPNIRAGFPAWFRDTNRVPLQLCLEEVPGCLFAAVDRPDLTKPLAFPNIPDELFYYSATATIGNQLLFAGVEMNFADNGDGTYDQVGFVRVRIRIDSTVAGNYIVTTPWKQYFFTVDQATIDANAGRRVINATEDIGLGPDGVFDGVLAGTINTYAYSQGAPFGAAPNLYLGDNTPRPLVGSTFTDPVTQQPANIFRIQGPPGFTTVSTNLFAVTGKLYLDPIPTPLTINKLTYARDVAGVQVSAFATTQAMSNQVNGALAFPLNFALTNVPSVLQLSGTGLPSQVLTTNNPADGKFFVNTGGFAFQGNLPANATVTNTADTPNTVKTPPLVDEVKITNATYNKLTSTLTISAQSLDTVANPTLSAFMPGSVNTLGTLSNGQLTVTFPVTDNSGPQPKTYNIPTETITVKSAIGGETTVPVITFSAAQNPPNAAPTQIAPQGIDIALSPNYTFTAIPGATGYKVYVFNNTANAGFDTGFITPTAAGCPQDIGICSIPQVTPLVAGNSYTWIVAAENAVGLGPWSGYKNFTALTVPAVPSSISPTGTANTTPTYAFNAVTGATGYQVYLFNNNTGTGVATSIITPTEAGCSTGTGICRISQVAPLTIGNNYTWIVSAQNAAGQGPWSSYLSFVPVAQPTAPNSISPSGTASTTPIYTFNAVAGATGYQVYVFDNTSGTGVAGSFITPALAGCAAGTGTCSILQATPLIPGNSYTWIVSAQNAAGQGAWSGYLNFTAQ